MRHIPHNPKSNPFYDREDWLQNVLPKCTLLDTMRQCNMATVHDKQN